MRSIARTVPLAFTLLAPVAALATAAASAAQAPVASALHASGNPATARGLNFTVPEVDDMIDFHGDLSHEKLAIFVAGNYFFAMAPLVAEFSNEHPQFRGHIFYVTIPPQLLVRAMQAGDTFTSGNMTFTVHPDVYGAALGKVEEMVRDRMLVGPAEPFIANDLTIMVPKGNPGHIRSLSDLGKPGVRIVMPNPSFEIVAKTIESSLRKAGGDALVRAVYVTKVANGETILTHIHHRQTPLDLMQGKAVAGVVWTSEAVYQQQLGSPLAAVPIAPAQNTTATYGVGTVRGAEHREGAREWETFMRSPSAQRIFAHFGFKRLTAETP